ncbi:MAG: hypothetical protein ACRYFL_12355 [Janthinobacterium lividum]
MKNWKKLLICCVSFVVAFFANVAIDLACGGEIDPYDYYISFFHNNLQGEKAYNSFYFTDYQYLFNDKEPESEAAVNAVEWANYLGNSINPNDVKKAMYGLDSTSNAAVLHQFLGDKNSMPDSLKHNTFLNALSANQKALQYYQFAKEVEPLASFSYDLWEPKPVDTTRLRAAATKAFGFAAVEKDAFLKLRYAYQAERLFHYGQNYERAKQVYTELINQYPSKSHVKGWALALKAGEDRKLGDTLQSAYQFSKVFADYPERRLQAYRNYHYIGVKAADVLPLAKTNAEKAVIYAIDGFADPEISTEYLEKVYAFEPASPMVGVLLVREINKLEQNYLTDRLNNVTATAYQTPAANEHNFVDQDTVKQQQNTHNWLYYVGSFLLIAGMVLLVITFKNKHNTANRNYQIGSVLLFVAGAGLLLYAVFTGKKLVPKNEKIRANPAFFTTVPDSVQQKYNQHIEKLVGFCDQLSAEKKYPEPAIATLTKAYLYWMQSKTVEGFNAINVSEKENLTPKMHDQQQLIKLLLSAQKIQRMDSVNENSLLPSLKWLDKKVVRTKTAVISNDQWTTERINRFATTSRDFYLHVLAPVYLRQRDTARAALALLKSESYGNYVTDYPYMSHGVFPDFWYNYLRSAQIQRLINWEKHPPENAWLQFFSADLQKLQADHLYELLGTAYLREHNYAAAVAVFAHQTEQDKRTTEDEEGDPFLDQLNDYPKIFSASTESNTKQNFAQAMASLQNKIKAEPKNPQNYYRFATALYNTSTYGNSWNLISYNWSSTDYARESVYPYDADYVKTSNAEKYYLKARSLSNNADFKAKCTFMAAKCQQKQQEIPSYMSNYETYEAAQKKYGKQMRQNLYFKELQQYRQTAFYKMAVTECSYLKDFINGK